MAYEGDPRNPKIVPGHGVPQIVMNCNEANSQSFKAGEFVKFSSGTVTVAVENDGYVHGIALKDATTVSSGNVEIPVQLISPGDEVLIQVKSGASYEAADTTCVAGVAYDVNVSSNLWAVDSADSTSGSFVFIDAIYDSAGTATYWGRFKPFYDASVIGGQTG